MPFVRLQSKEDILQNESAEKLRSAIQTNSFLHRVQFLVKLFQQTTEQLLNM